VDEERAAVLRAAHPFDQRLRFELVDQVNHRGAVDRHGGGQLGPVKDTGISARTLAETGLTASTAFSVSPQKVAAATLRAIGNPKAEIVVSIGPGRLLKALTDYFPALGPALNRLSGADTLMTSVADHREATGADPACHNNSQPA